MAQPDFTVFQGTNFDRNTVPDIWIQRLRSNLAEQNIEPSLPYIKKWWRTQSAIYLSRLSDWSLAKIRQRRVQKNLHEVRRGSWSAGRFTISKEDLNQDLSAGYRSLPSQAINWHIRRGDKDLGKYLYTTIRPTLYSADPIEMTLAPFDKFARTSDKLIAENPLSMNHIFYVTSDSLSIIQRAADLVSKYQPLNTTSDTGIMLITSSTERYEGADKPDWTKTKEGMKRLFIDWWVSIFMSLECNSWLGTRGSNWGSLIDELRCGWVDKCTHQFVEIGEEDTWADYGW